MLSTSIQSKFGAWARASPSRPSFCGSLLPVGSRSGRALVGRPNAHAELASALTMLDVDHLQQLVSHLPLAYEPVAGPCSLMNCGDVVHRSTLDLELRGEDGGLTWQGWLLLTTALSYFFLPPGPLPGAIDYYITSRIYRARMQDIQRDDIRLGRKLASGGFGSVFRGNLKDENDTEVIVKKAKEFGEAEVWMNERMMRLDAGKHCAELLAAFDERDVASPGSSPLDSDVWLVWKYEGPNTLWDIMEKREFPYNLEEPLLGRKLNLPTGPRRKLVSIKLALKQLLEALQCCHNTGIVHRDIKPQNCIVSNEGRIKLIDLGAAADLRIGINYVPKEYLLDPRYAPPQQYVMSTQTVRPPPLPVAAVLSPVLWGMECPDRFDMYSVGVTLLQMSFPSLRSDNNIIAFNKQLESYKWDLRLWREKEESKGGKNAALKEGFELLDLDGGAGWELLCDLMAYKPRSRPSASDALSHPWFTGSATLAQAMGSKLKAANLALSAGISKNAGALEETLMAGKDKGALTEGYIYQELGLEETAPTAQRGRSQTIAWWQERKSELKKKGEGTGYSSGVNLPPRRSAGKSSPTKNPAVANSPPPAKGSPSGGDKMKLPAWFNSAPSPGAVAAWFNAAPKSADAEESPAAAASPPKSPSPGRVKVRGAAADAPVAADEAQEKAPKAEKKAGFQMPDWLNGKKAVAEVVKEVEEEEEEEEKEAEHDLVSAKVGGSSFKMPGFMSGWKKD